MQVALARKFDQMESLNPINVAVMQRQLFYQAQFEMLKSSCEYQCLCNECFKALARHLR